MSYPRLYAANAAVNKDGFENLGLGMLSDAISCTVTEERNGEFELEMEYPIDGNHFSDIGTDKLLMAPVNENGNHQIFRIYKVEKPIDGISTIYAEHISYLLSNVALLPFGEADSNGDYPITSVTKAFAGIKENLIWKTDNANFPEFPFSFEASTVDTTGTFVLETPSTVRSVLGGTDGSILDIYGGEYEFDNFTVKLHKQRGTDTNVYLRYGKNITELKNTNDISSSYTGIVPYWKGSLQKKTTDSDGNSSVESYETIIYLGDKALWSDYTENYAYPLANVVDFSSEIESDYANKEDSDGNVTYYTTEDDIRTQLKTEAEAYLKNNAGWKPSDNIEVSFINLWDTPEYENFAALQKVNLCDTVHVVYPKLDIDVTMKVIMTKYDVINDRYESIELGEPKSSFTSSVANSTTSTESKIEQLETSTTSKIKQAQQESADLINGKMNNLLGVGKGIIQFDTDATGNITQIVATDKADRSGNLMVLNLNGLGFSTDGAKSFNDAIMLNGDIVASRVKVGILTDGNGEVGNGSFYLNMETGELYMKDGTFAGTLEVVKGKIGGFTITDNAIYMNKTGMGMDQGGGIYIGEDGISFGQTNKGTPVFSAWYGGSKLFPYAMVTLLSFTHGDSYKSCGSIDSWTNDGKYGYGIGTTVRLHVGNSLGGDADLFVDNDIRYGGECKYDSDARLKQDIEYLDDKAVDFILGLKPAKFAYKRDPDRVRHGFIAQDVQAIEYDDWKVVTLEPGFGATAGGEYLTLNYIGLIADIVKTIQYQNDRINDLESRIKQLEEELKK